VYYCIRSEINLLVAIFCCDRVILTTVANETCYTVGYLSFNGPDTTTKIPNNNRETFFALDARNLVRSSIW